MDEQIIWLKGHKIEFQEDDFERSFDIYVKAPDVINENTGLLLILEGLGGIASSAALAELREKWCNLYNVVTLGVNYLGVRDKNKNRQMIKADPEMVARLLSKLTPEQWAAVEASGRKGDINYLCSYFKGQDLAAEIQFRSELPLNRAQMRDYFDFGYIQTMDCLYAIQHVLNIYKLNTKRIFVYGVSFGGQLAQLCSKFAPNTFSLVADVAGWSIPDKVNLRPSKKVYLRTNVSGAMIGIYEDHYYADDKNSKYYVTDDMLKIRTLLDESHVNTYKQHFKGKILMFHTTDDERVPVKEKILLEKMYRKAKIDCTQLIFSQKDVDGEIVKSTKHANIDPIKLFEKYCGEYLLNDSWIKKGAETDFDLKRKIVYPSGRVNFVIDYSQDLPTITPVKIGKRVGS